MGYKKKDKTLFIENEEELFEKVTEGHTLEVFNPDKIDELHPSIKELILYFQNKAERKERPKRASLVPSEIVHLIPFIAILEPRYDGEEVMDYHIRLMGTEMVKTYGEQTGTMLSDLSNEQVSQRICETCDLVIKSKQPVVGSVSSFNDDKSFLKLLKVKVPMFDDEHKPDRVTQIISLIMFSA